MLVVFTLCVSNNKKMNINETQSKLQSIGLILMSLTKRLKANSFKRCITVLVPTKTRSSAILW